MERYAIAYENHEAYVETVSGKRIGVKVQPYGKQYVKITEGLNGGEVLKAQSAPRESGYNRMGPGTNANGKKNGNAQNGPGGNMGAGGPPPGMGGGRF